MPTFEMVCLANSRKWQGRCVAGVRTGGGWLRPVSGEENGTLHRPHYRLPDGSEPRLLDLLRVRLACSEAAPHHPENWLLHRARWELLARPAPSEILANLSAHLVSGPTILGCNRDSALASDFDAEPAAASLALIAPTALRWIVRRKRDGKVTYRVAFLLADAAYNLPMTDPAWETRLLTLPVGEHAMSKAGMRSDESVWLTISLSEPFQKDAAIPPRCYKLAAAVIVVRNGQPLTDTSVPARRKTSPVAITLRSANLVAYPDPFPDTDGPSAPLETIADSAADRAVSLPAHLAAQRQDFPRAYEKWSDREDRWLVMLRQSGLKTEQIAQHLQRQPSAIRSRIKKLFGEKAEP